MTSHTSDTTASHVATSPPRAAVSRTRRFPAAVALLSLLALFVLCPRVEAAWTSETIDDQAPASNGVAIAVPSAGRVHVSYQHASARAARYATNVYDTPWLIENIATSNAAQIGGNSAVAIDAGGNTHVTYYDPHQHAYHYQTNASGQWQEQTIHGSVGAFIALAVDGGDAGSIASVHIVAMDESMDLWHFTNASGNWERASFADDNTGQHVALAVDGNGAVHVAYVAYDGLIHRKYTSGAWQAPSEVGDEAEPFQPIAMSIDTEGVVHLAYVVYDDVDDDFDLRYASNPAGTWHAEKVADFAYGTNLALDVAADQDDPRVTSFNLDTGELVVSGKTSGSWQPVAGGNYNAPTAASCAAVTTDPDGYTHLVYIDIDDTTRNLQYVTNYDYADRPHGSDVRVTMERSPAEVWIGRTVTYTVTAENLGPDNAPRVVVTSDLPTAAAFVSASEGTYNAGAGQVRWEIDDLAAGDSRTLTIVVTAPNTPGTISNSAAIEVVGTEDFRTANNQAADSAQVIQPIRELVLAVAGTGGHLTTEDGLTRANYGEGEIITVKATPDPGYRVKQWHGTNNDSSTGSTNTVKIGQGETTKVEIEFEPIPCQLTATVLGGNGTIRPTGGTYDWGNIVRLTAEPNRRYRVKRWHGTNNDASTSSENTVRMNGDKSVSVEFEPAPNNAPFATIWAASPVGAGEKVTLDGSGSFDPDGDPLTYLWELEDDIDVAIVDRNSEIASFTAPVGYDDQIFLKFRLTVSDGEYTHSQTTLIRVDPAGTGGTNGPPGGKPPILPGGGMCGQGIGAVNAVAFSALCFTGLGVTKQNRRRRSR